MGQVYRATDAPWPSGGDRILPGPSRRPDRLARFEREARTLASLSHPHIAAVHGFERSSRINALVMELVEGEDLSHIVARSAAVDEALAIASQIAEALEAAHEQGIIHRDLKPANIRCGGPPRRCSTSVSPKPSIRGSSSDAMNSPTLCRSARRPAFSAPRCLWVQSRRAGRVTTSARTSGRLVAYLRTLSGKRLG